MTSKSISFAVIVISCVIMLCGPIQCVAVDITCRGDKKVHAAGCIYIYHPLLLATRDGAIEECRTMGGSIMPASNDAGQISNFKSWTFDNSNKTNIKQLCVNFWTPLTYDHSDRNVHLQNGDIFPETDWEPGVPFNESYACLAVRNATEETPALIPVDCLEKLHFTCITLAEPCSDVTCDTCEQRYLDMCDRICTTTTTSATSNPATTTMAATNSTTTTSVASNPITITSAATNPTTTTSAATNPTTTTSVATNSTTTTSVASTPDFFAESSALSTSNGSTNLSIAHAESPLLIIILSVVLGSVAVVALSYTAWRLRKTLCCKVEDEKTYVSFQPDRI